MLTKLVRAGLLLSISLMAMAGSAEEAAMQEDAVFAYVGSRTTKERNARGEGIEVYKLDAQGIWAHEFSLHGLTNPSFLVLNKARNTLFTVHGDQQQVSSFSLDQDSGQPSHVSTAELGGENPVHLALSPGERHVVVAVYASGQLVSLPVDEDGKIGEVQGRISLPGDPGPHREEQKGSRPHQILLTPDDRFYIVPDKGLDRIFTVEMAEDGALEIVSEVATREGAGPRHGVFSPDGQTYYVVNELDSTLAAYRYADGKLKAFQVVTTLPTDFVGNSRGAAILASPDGRFIYASNRGHDSIVRFSVDRETGRLGDPAWAPSGGERPRFMTFSHDGTEIVVANELSDTIVGLPTSVFDDAESSSAVRAETGSPVSIVFAP